MLQNNRPLSIGERALSGINTASFFAGEVVAPALRAWDVVTEELSSLWAKGASIFSPSNKNIFSESDSVLKHIFRDSPGHLSDTPENHDIIESVANNKDYFLGNDRYGSEWYGKVNEDGTQTWVRVRNNNITSWYER